MVKTPRKTKTTHFTACGKKSFLSKESDTKILHSIYFAYDVGIINSLRNKAMLKHM